jgi:hypothetical protein
LFLKFLGTEIRKLFCSIGSELFFVHSFYNLKIL